MRHPAYEVTIQKINVAHLSMSQKVHVERLGYTGLSKKMDGIWNPYNLKSIGRIYTFAS